MVFILSENRSGSTWLSYVLGTHEETAHLGEYFRPFLIKGHVVCRLCEARGLPQCEVFHGIEDVEFSQAFEFAFERTGAHTLIDASKSLEWLDRFRNSDSFAVKAIHLIRDPRGWIASERRRTPGMSNQALFERWLNHFYITSKHLTDAGIPFVYANYDLLCLDPERELGKLSKFLNVQHDQSSLEYWRKEHHGLGGNGAALNNLIRTGDQTRVTTGDDEYYYRRVGQLFYDNRWKEEPDADQLAKFAENAEAEQILGKCEASFRRIDELSGNLVA